MGVGTGTVGDDPAEDLAGKAAAAFARTVDTVRDITLELPGARTPQEAADVLLRDGRKQYVGILLLALAAVAYLATL